MKTSERLQVGDTVRLKSGGPDMKVVSPEVGFVYVTHAGLKDKPDSFPVHSLEKISN